MRQLAIALSSIGFLAACETPYSMGEALYDDAVNRIEAGECGVRHSHSMIAQRAAYYDVSNRINRLRQSPLCDSNLAINPNATFEPHIAIDGISITIGNTGGDRINWSVQRLRAVIDPATRRAHQAYSALPDRCQPFARKRLPRKDGLIALYLERAEQGSLPARRAYARQLTACAEAFRTAAMIHHAAGENEWVRFWLHSSGTLEHGLSEALLRDLVDASTDPNLARAYRQRLLFAVLDRVDLADISALERLASDDALAEVSPSDVVIQRIQGAIDLATAAGMDVHPTWRAIGPGSGDYSFTLTEWVAGRGLDLQTVPELFADVRESCTLDTTPSFLDFDTAPGGATFLECRLAHLRVGTAASVERARVDLLKYLYGARQDNGVVDAEMLQLASAMNREQLIHVLGGSESSGNTPDTTGEDEIGIQQLLDRVRQDQSIPDVDRYETGGFSLDAYGCHRPLAAMQLLWEVAAPTVLSRECDILAELAPSPDDFAALSEALPFDTCDAEALARPDTGGRRALYYAAQTGDSAAFTCFAQAAALDAAARSRGPASEVFLVGVHAGVRTGHLELLDWAVAGGSQAWSISAVIARSEADFSHLASWGTGPEPFEALAPARR